MEIKVKGKVKMSEKLYLVIKILAKESIKSKRLVNYDSYFPSL